MAAFDFEKRLITVHLPDRTDHAVCDKISGFNIDDSWTIVCPPDAGEVLAGAAADLADYFAVSFNLTLPLKNEATGKIIRYGTDEKLKERSWRIRADEKGIELIGCSEKYAARAGYGLEDMLNLNCGPVLEPCDVTRQARFSPRWIATGMAGGKYPDEHLRMIAHYGYDAISIGVGGAMEDPKRMEYLRDLMARAKKIGLGCLTSAPFKNGMHPSEPGAYEYYDSMYGKLFDLLPDLDALMVVGECCEFPSHDPRTTGKTWRESLDDEKSSPGWFPCSDYPEFVGLLAKVIHAHKPEAEMIFWTYNWGYEKQELREELIRKVPKDVTMMATFEMFEEIPVCPGVTEFTTDYTLWTVGPGKYFSTESKVAAERGLRMYTMSGTNGATWDIGDIPYVPAPQRWMERFKAVNNAQDTMALHGLRESHTMGMWPCIVPELAKYAYSLPCPDMDALLRRIVIRDYGEDNADIVLKAFTLFGEAMKHCVSTNEDQYGPARVGTSYPLVFRKPVSIPAGPGSNESPDREANPIYRYNLDLQEKLSYEIDEYEQMARLYEAGCALLKNAPVRGRYADALDELEALGRFTACSARTVAHVKRWHVLKGKLGIYLDTRPIWVGGRKNMPDAETAKIPLVPVEDPKPVVSELLEIAYAEIENAKASLPIVEKYSRIGFTQELGYCASPEQVRWKIDVMNQVISEELLPLL